MKAYDAFTKAVFHDGEVSVMNKQMAVAVALTTQCLYCIEVHTQEARRAGATDPQLAETAVVAAAMRGSAAMAHATFLFG